MRTGDLCKRQVVTATPEATLSDISRIMRASHVGCVVVVRDRGHLSTMRWPGT